MMDHWQNCQHLFSRKPHVELPQLAGYILMENVGRGEDPGIVDHETVLSLGAFYAKQPKWQRQEAKYE